MERSIFTSRSETLQSLLRQLRIDAGLRQVDLALLLEQPQSFVSKYECGERRLDLPELQQICEACGITLGEFVQQYEDATRDA